ncbi:histone-lysine N-methyltransferase NSD2-like [Ornithodoros turicata]|uniref:histone-lysine N-methyltransferase NSD2-like n=1 Tax=Ornithodoros turicata TaxID=34597 RepID=UPI003139C2AA
MPDGKDSTNGGSETDEGRPDEEENRSRFGRLRKPSRKLSDVLVDTGLRVTNRPLAQNGNGVSQNSTPSPEAARTNKRGRKKSVGPSPKLAKPDDEKKYLVGDLLWSKVGGYPYWPCMISFDPVAGVYTKLARGQHRLYHVQYFGVEAEHGWTQPGRIFPFEGLDPYLALGHAVAMPRKRPSWMVAIEEATAALPLSRAQRKHQLTFEYYEGKRRRPRNDVEKAATTPAVPAADTKSAPRGDICGVCEQTGAVLACRGPCHLRFHLQCLGLTQCPESFLCDHCSTGLQPCFACQSATDTEKCSLEGCGRFYHVDCLQQLSFLPCKREPLICPQHSCFACALDHSTMSGGQETVRFSGKLLRCVRCPVAYHGACLAAGSQRLGPSQILCPRHVSAKASCINVDWCFSCGTGGRLLCCEGCPAAFHEHCLDSVPEGPFLCVDCSSWKQPRHGDVVWVKLGCYRWWPAKVCIPNDIPANIAALEHREPGDFAVEFFGSHDYYWTHRGRVFLFEEGDRGGPAAGGGRALERLFDRALEEAREVWEKQQEARNESTRPAPFKLIRVSRPVSRTTDRSVDEAPLVCNCNGDDPCNTNCINRLLLYECQRGQCPVGDACQNQRFQRRQYAQLSVVRTRGRGWGLRADEHLSKGTFVIEYVGELIDEGECERRLAQLHQEHCTNFYFLTVERDRIIDAGPKGNLSRFMNHSCQPNCETQKWFVNGETRVGLFTIEDIEKGTELTFNYNLDCRGSERTRCHCGASNCSGYLGVRPAKAAKR